MACELMVWRACDALGPLADSSGGLMSFRPVPFCNTLLPRSSAGQDETRL